jgi:putative ABC transport system ATP-binding protein
LTLLVGPSGSGKSSLMRLLNRLDDPTSGEIRMDGRRLSDFPPLDLRRKVVMVGQQPAPFPGTAFENIAYGLRLQHLPEKEIEERTREAFQYTGLREERLTMEASRLSVGQQQRVCLARALALRPQALLLDEPTAALDSTSADRILRLALRLYKTEGMTILYVTHRLADAETLGGKALVLQEGEMVEFGDTRALLADPKSEMARLFHRKEAATDEEPIL